MRYFLLCCLVQNGHCSEGLGRTSEMDAAFSRAGELEYEG
jgi:hypothetical protein